MAKVFQIIATSSEGLAEEAVQNGTWHAAISSDAPRTVCGIQLEGDDGIASGPDKEGKVTCQTCRKLIDQIQSIKNWR